MRFFLTKILFKQGLLVGLTLLLASDLLAQDAQDRAYIMQKTNQGALMGIRTRGLQKQQNNLQTLSRQRVQMQVVNARGQLGVFYDFDENGNPVYAFDDNVDAAASGRTDRIWTGGSSGLDLTGAGIEIGVWESGYARATHQEFAGRASNGGDGGSDTSHGTHTGGTLIASGVNPSARGMASAATIKNYTATNMISEAAAFAAAGGILANNSNTPGGSVGTYDANARDMDNVVYNAPYYFHGKSAGNDGNNYGSVLKTTQLSKNLLVVGNCNDVTNYTGPSSVTMSSSSSYGPTPDWRIKPDVTNNGTSVTSSNSGSNTAYTSKSGTSMSTPATIGTVALLQQHYHNLNTVYMRAATVKALLINTADEAGADPGPDFASGWGLVNAERAAEVISNNGVNSIVEELTLNNGGTYTSTIISDGSTPLSLSIAWTDPAGTISSSTNPVLVNDLDVRVTGNSNTYSPWAMIPNGSFNNYTDAAQKGDNFRDNVEKIDAVLAAGTYTVSVTHKGTLTNGSQDFSLIINGVVVSLDSEAPTAPTALNSSNVTENSVDLSWTASTDNVGVMSYEIFEGSTSVGTSTTTNFSVTGLAHSTTFSFTVNAKDAAGNTSGNSNTVNVTTLTPVPDTQAPTIPTGLSSSNITQTSVDLSWTASTDNVGVTGYDVLEGATVVGSSTSTNFTVTGLLANTSHSYTVKAKDTAGNVSGNSNVINITTLAVPPCSGISSFPYSESFDGNTGLWTQETSDDLNWSFDTNSTPSSNTGPSAPTDGSSYMFTEATGNGTGFPNKVALLTSPCVDLSSLGNAELNFDYHMYGAAMGTLEIRASTDGGANWTAIWSQTGDQGNQWFSQSVSLSGYSGSVINLQISGTTGSNFTSDMAIDNLQIVSLIVDTQAPSVPTGLAASNTSDTGTTLSWTASTDNVGVTSYEVFQGGTSIGTSATTSFNVTGLTAETAYSFAVNASDAAGNTSANSAALSVTTTAVPPCSGISSFPYSESFDGNTGLWTQETSDDLNWSFDTNSTPSSNTGPSAPTDGSSYMFTEASGSGNGFPNKVALLTSPCVDLSSLGNAELSFDYHMYGAAMGTLEMRASTDGGANWTTIWSQTGDQGNQWFSQSVSLAAYSGLVINLQISGTTGSDFTSDMAVDNLQIVSLIVDTDAPSVPTGLTASNTSDTGTTLSWTASTDNVGVTSYKVFQGGTSIGTSATTSFNVTGLTAETAYSFTVNASDATGNTSANSAALSVTTTAVPPCSGISSFPYSESFDGNTGLWTQETSDDLNWSFDTNSTPSSNTGPSAPTDGSSYMFTEATGNGTGFPNKVALLTSPCVDLSSLGNAELNFDYHMYGAAMGTLEMRASTDGGANWTTIWSQTGDQGNQWFSQSVNLSAYSGSVINLQISGTTGSNFTSDMAIDNLQIVSLIVDTQAPSVPTGLAASNTSDTGTTLSWTASTDNVGVTSYEVFQGGTSIGTSATPSFSVTGLTASTTYSFAVNASDAAGNTSANSSSLNVTTNDPATTPVNFKVAFIGDAGTSANADAVLNLISAEGADAVVHAGDMTYSSNPGAFEANINAVLGANFPYFWSAGNHDDHVWRGAGNFQELGEARMNRLGIPWTGDLGVASTFTYQGIFFVAAAPQELGQTQTSAGNHIKNSLAANNADWSIAYWHKNQTLMQLGGKGNEAGWPVYEESRKGGALIATGHEHSYARSHEMSDMQNQGVSTTSNTVTLKKDNPATTGVDEGRSFAFVSGLGGQGIRVATNNKQNNPWWASTYYDGNGGQFAALFGEFNYNGDATLAHFYYKDIDGVVVDDFFVRTEVESGSASLRGSNPENEQKIDVNDDNTVSVYPNPFNGAFTVNYEPDWVGGNLRVLSLNGAVIYQTELISENKLTVADSEFKRGFYLLVITKGNRTYRSKIIKQ